MTSLQPPGPAVPTDEAAPHDALIEAIAARRDRSAFARLFEHFAPRLKSYLMRVGADPSTAEEVAQEAMLMVWRKAESFDRRQSSASTWIFTIARNKRIDRLRRERRPELDPFDPALVPATPNDGDRTVWSTQVEQRLRGAIESLPAEQSDLVRRAYFDDLSHREIAELTGLPLGTVKSRIRLAINRLREEVDDLE
jgi:RNA polymerase sigma-70 factor (ECF subfamily)